MRGQSHSLGFSDAAAALVIAVEFFAAVAGHVVAADCRESEPKLVKVDYLRNPVEQSREGESTHSANYLSGFLYCGNKVA